MTPDNELLKVFENNLCNRTVIEKCIKVKPEAPPDRALLADESASRAHRITFNS